MSIHKSGSYFLLALCVAWVPLMGCSADGDSQTGQVPVVLESGGEESQQTPKDGVPIAATQAAESTFEALSLCTLVQNTDIAGLYQVERLVSHIEQDLYLPGQEEKPFTYATLARVDGWGPNASQEIVLRYRGGQYPDGTVVSADLSLRVGEKIGLLAYHSMPEYENGGFDFTNLQYVFHQRDDGSVSNGPLVVESYDKLGSMVRAINNAQDCPVDVQPYEWVEQAADESDVVEGGKYHGSFELESEGLDAGK